eukprot:CAMPEP_0170905168 /NCGR_PEP_ID=MMETSP0734-20130129/50865_1 /TAXON_ID=186038 /ORGANISM="Fragilariopsis kerguelensis, Strain L26-C5" /LENGTH=363 /DNA_ID=CAMNT_0011300821 /DNA_START=338 /DNA_END=1425 /DNA_ORIENTATION=-
MKKKKKKNDEPNKQQMMMTLIEEEQRLLWRNETPLDDFFSNDNDNDNDSSSIQNNFSNENYQSEDSNRNDEGDEEIMTLLEVDELLFVDNDSFDDDVVDTKGNEDEEKSFDGSNNNNDSNIDNDNSKGSNNEDENEKLDCLWRVITGTGCTSISDGDIIDGYQHMYLNADGKCHYNDFLGYYRAGCSSAGSSGSSSSSQSDQQEQEQKQHSLEPQRRDRLGLPPPPPDFMRATTNSESYSSNVKATIQLQDVFCNDPNCSMGCLQDSVIRPHIQYTSHFCYLSGFYAGGQTGYGFDVVDTDDKENNDYGTAAAAAVNKKENHYRSNRNMNDDDDAVDDDATANNAAVEADVRNIKYQFSFEFV